MGILQSAIEREFIKDKDNMCEIIEAVAVKRENKREKKTRIEDIKNLMLSLNLSPTQAMNALKIPDDLIDYYLKLLNE